VFTRESGTQVVCDFNCFAETEGHLQVTDSHMHCKGIDITETVQDKDSYCRSVIGLSMDYRIVAIPMTLSDLQGHGPY